MLQLGYGYKSVGHIEIGADETAVSKGMTYT